MPRVFDYTEEGYENRDGILTLKNAPIRYNNSINTSKPVISGTWVDYGAGATSKARTDHCPLDTTSGEILFSDSQMNKQTSCTPHAYNAGNYYNLPSQLGDAKSNSVCPRGWSLSDGTKDTDYSHFLLVYGIDYNASGRTNQDAALLNLPLSFLRTGAYSSNGTLNDQGNYGVYRMTSLRLGFSSGGLNPVNGTNAHNGYSLRCATNPCKTPRNTV